jgi:RimJ/RimL family protein N-acetyltransferase
MRTNPFNISISSGRLLLRPLQSGDIEPLFALFNNWNVVRLLSSPPWPYARKDAESYVHRAVHDTVDSESFLRGSEIPLAITRSDELIGCIGVRARPASHLQRSPGPNLGYWLGEPYWGQGYMTEAARALIAHTFDCLAVDAIFCGAFTDNSASLRVQEKLGFVDVGETMLHSNPRDGEFPHVNTELTRQRFELANSEDRP